MVATVFNPIPEAPDNGASVCRAVTWGFLSLISSIFEVEKVKASAWGKNTLVSVHAISRWQEEGSFPDSVASLPRVELYESAP